MKKTILKIAIPVVLMCLLVLPFAYSAMYPPPPKPRIFFLEAPSPWALYGPDEDYVFVEAAVVTSSTYGPFTLVIVEHGWCDGVYANEECSGVWHYVEHWYATNLFAAQKYQHIVVRYSTDQSNVFDSYDVTLASIVVTSSSADQLSVSVLAWTRTGKVSITAQYMADTSAAIVSGLHGGLNNGNPGAQYTGVTARRALSTAVVTGVPLGSRSFSYGQFRYIHTELYDPSLLS